MVLLSSRIVGVSALGVVINRNCGSLCTTISFQSMFRTMLRSFQNISSWGNSVLMARLVYSPYTWLEASNVGGSTPGRIIFDVKTTGAREKEKGKE